MFVVALLPRSMDAQSNTYQARAVERLLLAFDSADVVALADHHLSKVDSDLRIRLIRQPAFPKKARSIVVEFGNALYQPVLDRYIRGENVAIDQLQQVWQNTTQLGGALDSPVYANFYTAVRDVNRGLPPAQHLRVFAGDPPIDWDQIRTRKDWEAFMIHRDDSPVSILRSQILSKGEKALIIYGGAHIRPTGGIAKGLQTWHPGRVFVYSVDPNEEDGIQVRPDPAIYRGTPYGAELERRRRIVYGR